MTVHVIHIINVECKYTTQLFPMTIYSTCLQNTLGQNTLYNLKVADGKKSVQQALGALSDTLGHVVTISEVSCQRSDDKNFVGYLVHNQSKILCSISLKIFWRGFKVLFCCTQAKVISVLFA